MLAWMPYLTADLGSIAGGLWSDFLVRRKVELIKARSLGMWPFALLMPLSIVVAFTTSRVVCLALICLVTFAHMAWKTNMTTLTNDIYPVKVVGRVAGLVAFGNGLGGTVFTAMTGWIVQNFGYETVFVIMGCMHPTAYLIFRLLVKKPITPSPSD
jgi:ACS family hexuronate transporter-like MFS transporter